MAIRIAALLFAVALPHLAWGQIPWTSSLDAAKGVAKQQQKLVLLHFYSDDCPPCRRLEQNVFPNASVQQAMGQGYVPVKINTSEHPEIARTYNVFSWPTDVVLDNYGREIYRTISPQDPNQYTEVLRSTYASYQSRMPYNPQIDGASSALAASQQAANQYLAGQAGQYTQSAGQQLQSTQDYAQHVAQQYQQGNDYLQQTQQAAANTMNQYTQQANNYLQQAQQSATNTVNQYTQQAQQYGANATTTANDYLQQAQQSATNTVNQYTQQAQQYGANATTTANDYLQQTQQAAANTVNQYTQQAQRYDANASAYGVPNAPDVTQPSMTVSPGTGQLTQNPYVTQPQAPVQQPVMPQSPIQPTEAPTPESQYAAVPPTPPYQPTSSQRQLRAKGLDGYCPFTLLSQKKWAKGDARYGAIHRSRTYLFVDEAAQQAFLAAPDRYAPMLSGYDPVAFRTSGQLVEGSRKYGLTFMNQVFLFESEDSLRTFEKSPELYLNTVHQAMQATATTTR